MAAPLLIGFGDERRHLDWPAGIVDRDEGEVARVRVAPVAADEILGLDPDADLHRRASNEVHARLHDHELAEVDRLAKVDPIDGDGDTVAPRMPDRGDRRRAV